ncbi:MAG: hypothetical protein Q4B15_07915 [Lachnospiraceae bacterium]|nr:hypothetical protein [Lachnospiraceae bacterium]
MGIAVMVMGASGSGKSASLRNFAPDEIGLMNVAGKPLPFRGKFVRTVNNADYRTIFSALKDDSVDTFVIDDSQYLMAFESFSHAKEQGYAKFTNMALNFYNLVEGIRKLPPEKIVYFLHHSEVSDDGRIKAKTLGKMLDNHLTVEGLFSIVLLCQVEGDQHYFLTNSDGSNSAKSPMGMFDKRIDNDLKMVDTAIRNYYEMPIKNTKEKGKGDTK